MAKTINVIKDEAKYVISLNSPPLNVMTIQMMNEISDAVCSIASDSKCKVLVIRGEGKCFSAGADVKEHLPEMVDNMLASLHKMCVSILNLNIPTISIVHGMALGGGLELAILTDLTYASETAKLGQPEIKLGVFAPIAVAIFPKLTGTKKVYELLLTGKTISGLEAKQIGLVNDALPDDKLFVAVDSIANEFTALSLPALVACKSAIRKITANELEKSLVIADDIYKNDAMGSEDAVEGLRSFLEKRKPQWKDR